MARSKKGVRAFEVGIPRVIVREKPDDFAANINELLYGEAVDVIDDNGSWGHIRSVHDGYEGFVPMPALKLRQEKGQRVIAPVTHIYEAPNFKLDPLHELFFLSHVQAGTQEQNGFIKLGNGKWVFKEHIAQMETNFPDHVEVAMLFHNAPYVWGGRSVMGVDCSGLVQLALMATGKSAPRDSGPQSETVGTAVQDAPKRGDFVFFKGHVAIMINDRHAVNATSRHMRCIIEPLEDLEKAYKGITAIRRV